MAVEQSDAMVFFGAGGDLAYKKIFRRCRPWLDAIAWICR